MEISSMLSARTYIIATQNQILLLVDCTYFCNKVKLRNCLVCLSPFQPKHHCSAGEDLFLDLLIGRFFALLH